MAAHRRALGSIVAREAHNRTHGLQRSDTDRIRHFWAPAATVPSVESARVSPPGGPDPSLQSPGAELRRGDAPPTATTCPRRLARSKSGPRVPGRAAAFLVSARAGPWPRLAGLRKRRNDQLGTAMAASRWPSDLDGELPGSNSHVWADGEAELGLISALDSRRSATTVQAWMFRRDTAEGAPGGGACRPMAWQRRVRPSPTKP